MVTEGTTTPEGTTEPALPVEGETPGGGPAAELAPAPEIPVEVIEKYLAALPDEQTSKFPSFNRRVDRGITKLRNKLEEDHRKNQIELAQARQLVWQYDAMAPNQRLENVEANPQLISQVQQARRRITGTTDARSIAERILKGLQAKLQSDERFTDLDWEKVITHEDPAEFMHDVIQAGLAKEKKRMDKETQAAVKAEVNQILAKYNLTGPLLEPSSPAAPGGSGRFTKGQLEDPAFYAAHRKEILKAFGGER